jgi:hypothetical protein
MGIVFWVLGYISGFLTLVLLALSISSGLYLLAELAEEFPSLSGKITKYMLGTVFILHVLLLIDGLPLFETAMSIMAHCMYATMLRNFPFIDLLSITTAGSVLGFVGCNVMWLMFFTRDRLHEPLQIVGFFVLCVWSIPCALFVSLTLNDNTLPVLSGPGALKQSGGDMGDLSMMTGGGKKKNMFKMITDSLIGLFENCTHSGIFQVLNTMNNKRK